MEAENEIERSGAILIWKSDWNGPGSSDPPSDIDHVVAASRVNLATPPQDQTVEVKGWPELATDAEK